MGEGLGNKEMVMQCYTGLIHVEFYVNFEHLNTQEDVTIKQMRIFLCKVAV